MCKEVEKVLNEANNEEPVCTVVMDGEENVSTDFVCVLGRDNGNASIFYNTDALTLGMSIKMIARAFVDTMQQLTEEERESVQGILGEAFCVEVPKEATE